MMLSDELRNASLVSFIGPVEIADGKIVGGSTTPYTAACLRGRDERWTLSRSAGPLVFASVVRQAGRAAQRAKTGPRRGND
jgi:hypothetical protein